MNNTKGNFLKLAQEGKRIILFGAGNEMVKAMEKIIYPNHLTVDYMVDNDFRKWYTKYFDIEIKEPTCLDSEDMDNIIVLITSIYPYRIEKQLNRLGGGGTKYYFSSLLFMEEHIGNEQFMLFF